MAAFLALGGAAGTLLRFYMSGYLPQYRDFPVGTLMVNLLASIILGYLYGSLFWGVDISPDWRAFLGVGFCGALSTFSTFSYETFMLLREREYYLGVFNILANVILTILMVYVGFIMARR